MKRLAMLAAGGLIALLPSVASARSHFFFGFNVGVPFFGGGSYYRPYCAPTYYAPSYSYAPAYVYSSPPVVYSAPPAVVYSPPPAVVYAAPVYSYSSYYPSGGFYYRYSNWNRYPRYGGGFAAYNYRR